MRLKSSCRLTRLIVRPLVLVAEFHRKSAPLHVENGLKRVQSIRWIKLIRSQLFQRCCFAQLNQPMIMDDIGPYALIPLIGFFIRLSCIRVVAIDNYFFDILTVISGVFIRLIVIKPGNIGLGT